MDEVDKIILLNLRQLGSDLKEETTSLAGKAGERERERERV
jgi:hypothetical protein